MKSPVGAGQKGRETMSDDDPVLECARQMATITAFVMEKKLAGRGPLGQRVVGLLEEPLERRLEEDRLSRETIRREELERMNRQLQRRIDEADRVIVAQAHRMLEHGAL